MFEDTGGFLLSKLCESEPLDIAASLAIRIEIATALAEAHYRTSSLAVSCGHFGRARGWHAWLIDFSNDCRASTKMRVLS
ncbi:MAG TPA: hypothetical protein VHJ19_02160, partial [Gammaproteobacteria bacterium]|nr:hypothetical protein [Gammaproteobacteria bacterium]